MINWTQHIEPYKEDLLRDLEGLLRIPSVKNTADASEQAPFGPDIQAALDYMLNLGKRDGFLSKDVNHYAGHLEIGQGKKLLGILCHLDVVAAEAEQWQTQPFEPVLKDGKLYARGALDDKGPTLMAYYALKILNEMGVTWNRRLRLILGTDEENQWEGVKHYFKAEEMPDFGIVPDGIFPMIYAEKGVVSFDFTKKDRPSHQLLHFESGKAYNLVPDLAIAELCYPNSLEKEFSRYLKRYQLQGKFSQKDKHQFLTLHGKSAHGAGPEKGINAGLHLAAFLKQLKLDPPANRFLSFLTDYFSDDSEGKKLGIDFQDQELGDVTVNTALIHFHKGSAKIGINLRYPASTSFDDSSAKLSHLAKEKGYAMKIISHQTPSQTDLNSPEIQLLLSTYQKHTGDKTQPLAIGGITYGRIFKHGVTFGPAFLGKPATLHQPNEFIELEDLFKALEIYLDALYQLATAEGQT
ncbi:dipeptidase PepV [Streptococcus dentiloxodontae]